MASVPNSQGPSASPVVHNLSFMISGDDEVSGPKLAEAKSDVRPVKSNAKPKVKRAPPLRSFHKLVQSLKESIANPSRFSTNARKVTKHARLGIPQIQRACNKEKDPVVRAKLTKMMNDCLLQLSVVEGHIQRLAPKHTYGTRASQKLSPSIRKVQHVIQNTRKKLLEAMKAPQTLKSAQVATQVFTSQKRPAEVISEAATNRAELAAVREKAKKSLKAVSSSSPSVVAKEISLGMKGLVARLYQEGEKALGTPPCRYCVAGLGSLGRNESGPYPDYDNFIIIENNSPEARQYFTRLSQYVADRIVRLGDENGFHLCHGNLNSPYQVYEHRYSSDRSLHRGGRDELLTSLDSMDVQIGDVFDSSPMAGDTALYDEYMTRLLKQNPAKAEAEVLFAMKRNILKMNSRKELSPIIAANLPEIIHIKEDLLRLPQGVVTALALHYGIKEKNSSLRIEELRKLGVFSDAFALRLTTALEHLLRFRLQSQTAYKEELELVISGDFASFEKFIGTMQAKLTQAEGELETEITKLGQTFGVIKKAQETCQNNLKELESNRKKWTAVVFEKEMHKHKKELYKITTETCQEKIDGLDKKITAAKAKNDLASVDTLEKEKNELQILLNGLWKNIDFSVYCRDISNPKISQNQYAKELGIKPPEVAAFTDEDKALLKNVILPTLRELFTMAEASVKTGKLNPAAFKPN